MLLVGLFSKDFYYRKKLSEALMSKGEKLFTLYSFSNCEHLLSITKETTLDVLLIEEDEYKKYKKDIQMNKSSNNYIILTEAMPEQLPGEDDQEGIIYMSKYSTTVTMVQGIHNFYQDASTGECKIIGIASEVHSCGKTSLAYQLCEILQEKGDALLIIMDYRNSLFTSKECGLSWIMYELCKSLKEEEYISLEGNYLSQEVFHQLLKENVKKFDHVNYLPACDFKEEMDMIQDTHMTALIGHLRGEKQYSYIVIDFNDQLLYGDSVASCDVLICPTKKDCFSEEYSRKYLQNIRHNNAMEIMLPHVATMSTMKDYYRELQWSALGGTAQQLVKRLGL